MEEIVAGRRFDALAEALFVADGGSFETRATDALVLDIDGIAGDYHAGPTRLTGGREPWYPRRTRIRNERQLSIVSAAELAEAAAAMAIDEIRPEWIGANLVLGGIDELSWLPARTRLFFADGATLVVEGQNAPCRSAGGSIAKHHADRDGLEFLFVKAAKRLRGIVAWVEKAGTIKAGEKLVVKLPEQRLYR